MKDVPAIVAAAPRVNVEKAADEIRQMHHEVTEAEQYIEKVTNEAGKKRLAIGKRLIAVRGVFPRKGPKSSAWGSFLKSVGVEQRTALRYMELAGFVEGGESDTDGDVSDSGDLADRDIKPENVPTYAEAGIDKRSRKEKAKDAIGAKQTHEHLPAKTEPPAVDAPTPAPTSSEKHAAKPQVEVTEGRDAALVALVARINALSPPDRLRLAAELLEHQRGEEAYKIASQVVAELGAAMALAYTAPEQKGATA